MGSKELFNGGLFEPHSISKSNEIYNIAKSVLGTSQNYWIGLDSLANEWQYASDGSPKILSTNGWNGLDDFSSEQCAIIYASNGNAEDVKCSLNYYSICESFL